MSAAGKVTTAALRKGDRILLRKLDSGLLDVAYKKTGAVVATVEFTTSVAPKRPGRQSRYVIVTDAGTSVQLAPSQTHWLAKT